MHGQQNIILGCTVSKTLKKSNKRIWENSIAIVPRVPDVHIRSRALFAT